jgi:hypothetical protein
MLVELRNYMNDGLKLPVSTRLFVVHFTLYIILLASNTYNQLKEAFHRSLSLPHSQ